MELRDDRVAARERQPGAAERADADADDGGAVRQDVVHDRARDPAPVGRVGARRGCPPASTATPSVEPGASDGDARGRSRPSTSRSAPRSRRPSSPLDEVLALEPGHVLRFGVPGRERRAPVRRQGARTPRAARPQRQLPRRAGHRHAGGGGMTTEDALIKLAESTGEPPSRRCSRSSARRRSSAATWRSSRAASRRCGRSPCPPSPPTSRTSTASPAATSSS